MTSRDPEKTGKYSNSLFNQLSKMSGKMSGFFFFRRQKPEIANPIENRSSLPAIANINYESDRNMVPGYNGRRRDYTTNNINVNTGHGSGIRKSNSLKSGAPYVPNTPTLTPSRQGRSRSEKLVVETKKSTINGLASYIQSDLPSNSSYSIAPIAASALTSTCSSSIISTSSTSDVLCCDKVHTSPYLLYITNPALSNPSIILIFIPNTKSVMENMRQRTVHITRKNAMTTQMHRYILSVSSFHSTNHRINTVLTHYQQLTYVNSYNKIALPITNVRIEKRLEKDGRYIKPSSCYCKL